MKVPAQHHKPKAALTAGVGRKIGGAKKKNEEKGRLEGKERIFQQLKARVSY